MPKEEKPKSIHEMIDKYPYTDMIGKSYRAGLISTQEEIEKWIEDLEKPPKRKQVSFLSGSSKGKKEVKFYVRRKNNLAEIQILKKLHGGIDKKIKCE